MKKNIALSSGLAVALIITGCATVNPSTERNLDKLQDKNWVLSQVGETKLQADATQSSIPSIQFDNAQVSGTDGCNNFTGGYAVKCTKIRFSQLASTARACLNATDVPEKFSAALAEVTDYEADKSELKFKNKDQKVVLVFKNQSK